MFVSISAVSPQAVLRTGAHLPYVMPFMFGAAVALNACAEQSGNDLQSGNNPEIVSASYETSYTTVRKGPSSRVPTFDEELAALMRYGSNGP